MNNRNIERHYEANIVYTISDAPNGLTLVHENLERTLKFQNTYWNHKNKQGGNKK